MFTPVYAVYTFGKAFAQGMADVQPALDVDLMSKFGELQHFGVVVTRKNHGSLMAAARILSEQCKAAGLVRFGQLPMLDPRTIPIVERLRAPKHGIAVRLWSKGWPSAPLHFEVIGTAAKMA